MIPLNSSSLIEALKRIKLRVVVEFALAVAVKQESLTGSVVERISEARHSLPSVRKGQLRPKEETWLLSMKVETNKIMYV